jgi:hypothetical protein
MIGSSRTGSERPKRHEPLNGEFFRSITKVEFPIEFGRTPTWPGRKKNSLGYRCPVSEAVVSQADTRMHRPSEHPARASVAQPHILK